MNRRAALKQAEIDLSRTKIHAPMDGTVISRTVEVGQTVPQAFQRRSFSASRRILRRIIIEAQVGEADIGGIAAETLSPSGSTLTAIKSSRAKSVRCALQAAKSAALFLIRRHHSFERRHEALPGMTATLDIELDKRANVARIPAEALRYKPIGKAADETGEDKSARRAEKAAELKDVLKLSSEQERLVTEALEKLAQEEDAYRAAKAQVRMWGRRSSRARLLSKQPSSLL